MILSQMGLDLSLIEKLQTTFFTVQVLFLSDIFVPLKVLQEAVRCGAVVSLITVETESLEALGTLELVSPVVVHMEVFHHVSVEGSSVAADPTLVRHLVLHVNLQHVMYQMVLGGVAGGADLTDELLASLQMLEVHVRVCLLLTVKVSVAISALREIDHVYGLVSVLLHVKMKVLHKFQIIHKNLPTNVTLESLNETLLPQMSNRIKRCSDHICFEFCIED